MNEQERLARLIGGEGFDPSQSGDMIADSLKNALGEIKPKYYDQVQEEIVATDSVQTKKHSISNIKKNSPNVNTESLLINIYSVYDSLVDLFQQVGMENNLSEELTQNIWLLEKCISEVGGQVEHFIPEDHVSGLVAPSTLGNAVKTIDTTKKCYRLGEIKNDHISKDGNTISIEFHGQSNNEVTYVAKGTIVAKNGWMGNEAIDYIYKVGGGKMTVKAYVDGKWVNQGKSYDIHWELDEMDMHADIADDIDEGSIKFAELVNGANKIKQERTSNSENKSDNDISEDFNVVTENQ